MVAGLLVATTLTVSSCNPNSNNNIELGGEAVAEEDYDYNSGLTGDVVWTGEDEEQTQPINQESETNVSSPAENFGN